MGVPTTGDFTRDALQELKDVFRKYEIGIRYGYEYGQYRVHIGGTPYILNSPSGELCAADITAYCKEEGIR